MSTTPRLAACAILLSVGCHSIGPGTVARDRFDYSGAISESWKRQTLLNIVKMRYLDPPIFVDVGQIVSGYSLESGATVGGQVASKDAVQGNSLLLGATLRFTDRPTITYTPLTGNRFVKSLMTPLTPASVFFTIQSGWPADGVLLATTASINGLKNQETSLDSVTPPDPEFLKVLALLRKIQRSGAVAMRVLQSPEKQETVILTFRAKNIPQETLDDIREVRRLLRLNQDAEEFKLVFGAAAADDKEVAVITRSLLHLMQAMSLQVEVPAQDLAESRAVPGFADASANSSSRYPFSISSSDAEPDNAFVEIFYRDHWFWVDDRDLRSKRAFAFMMMLFTLADSGEKESPPLITIPAQ